MGSMNLWMWICQIINFSDFENNSNDNNNNNNKFAAWKITITHKKVKYIIL